MILQNYMSFKNSTKIGLGFKLAAGNHLFPVIITISGRYNCYTI